MSWNVISFESDRGEKFVEEFIKKLDPSTIAKVAHEVDLLEKHGPFIGMPHSKKITAELHELRIRGKQEVRIIYAFVKRNIYLLHVFTKKRQKLPQREVNTAYRRLRSLTVL